MTDLRKVEIYNNAITRIEDGLFSGLQMLEEIRLYSNRIHYFRSQDFLNQSDLPRLWKIELQNNRLTSLEP